MDVEGEGAKKEGEGGDRSWKTAEAGSSAEVLQVRLACLKGESLIVNVK